ncbi:hypothetical protein BB560_001822 [Smittium megazygosporum]|uniref:sphingomyelin phosphodiesterase n=1 Tax=Smittium megazygosporum TaxID=133381 RepID=A0A2T9ZGH2_9FUNG|nr:hypothetical protein BB560_001822 [Smittium megazygosporum]
MSRPLRLLSQNMFIRPPGISNSGNDFKDERLEYLLENYAKEYDVLCFMEMFQFGSNRHSNFIKKCTELGFKYHVASPPKGLFSLGIDAGLLILSKYPILQNEFIQYARGVHSDALSLKGALYAKVQIPGQAENGTAAEQGDAAGGDNNYTLHLFATHTQASYGQIDKAQKSIEVRAKQLATLSKFIISTLEKHQGSEKEPVLLVGDMNVDSRAHVLGDYPYEIDERDGKESSAEYLRMIDILSGKTSETSGSSLKQNRLFVTDVLYKALDYHPVTSGATRYDEENKKVVPLDPQWIKSQDF